MREKDPSMRLKAAAVVGPDESMLMEGEMEWIVKCCLPPKR
jgi:hypothetical protein